jgi:two-component system sensor histidine kinase PilS (NtrC family)
MLGLAPPQTAFSLAAVEAMAPLTAAFDAWREQHAANAGDSLTPENPGAADDAVFITLTPGENVSQARRDLTVHLKLRFARSDSGDVRQAHTVIFMQDIGNIENQAHQLKLASMGRLTASLAHEVRNPLSAIGHAAALLDEDVTEPAQRRLLRIVGDNVERVNRLIGDILHLSRKAQIEAIALPSFFADLLTEFKETHGLAEHAIVLAWTADLNPQALVAHFDALHLRQIVVNLLTNAIRYASGEADSIRLQVVQNKGRRLELHVLDDGPGIVPTVRAHLFEPFYTTSSKGTGLGLYVARELCLNNAALLDYEYRNDALARPGSTATGRFVLRFSAPRPRRAPAAANTTSKGESQ